MNRREFVGGVSGMAAAMALPAVRPREVLASELPADLTSMSASVLSAAIRQRHVRCKDVMQAYLARIHRYNPVYNAIVSMVDDDVLIEAAEYADRELDNGEYRGWMHGMPHAVKDLSDAKGLPTAMGSPIFAGQVADKDGVMISRIRDQGAIFIGKTNTPEWGMGSQSYNPVFGATGSAYDPKLTAGGSSGGAACGLGTQMLPVADGGDMMGSLRNPGAYNNVIGFRPTFGRVPEGGEGDLFYLQLAVGGPMGRNSEDTVRLLTTIAGGTPAEPLALRDDLPSHEVFDATSLQDIRVGWMRDYDGYLETEPGVLELCESSLQKLTAHGAVIEPCKPDYDMDRLWRTWLTLRHWRRHTMLPLYNDPELRKLLKPEAVWEIEGLFNTSSTQIFEAGIARADWFRALQSLFEKYDFLVLPTSQVFPFSKDIHWPKKINDREMDTYHRWMEVVIGGSLAGLPVVNVPAGFDGEGRPMGMQVMGPFGEDRRVLEFAMAYESVTDHLDQRPTLVDKT
ncbi:MAG: amidase [Gammaproteobacteria bacterium]|nr:amidase [Gammaproteobacteria bacterium]MCP5093350.1 amidase [Gammaproteobacteria bacterium]